LAVAREHSERRVHARRLAAWAAITGLILLIPLIAMQFTDEVKWTVFDFVFLGVLLFGAGAVFELLASRVRAGAYSAAVGVALAAGVLLVLVTGAVGIIGSEHNDANLMYAGVLAVGLVGAIIARFEPHGMARAMVATALTQAAVAVIALIGRMGDSSDDRWWLDIVGVTTIFVAMWLSSSLLFEKAAHTETPTGRRALA
jgi:peptidoglycan/LPS O-acetylase OafA/YrhL